MKRVLLTGASGFIGTPCVAALQRRGFAVHAMGRRSPSTPGVVFHQTDLLDPAALRPAVRAVGASHLLHLAWCAQPGRFWTDPANLDWTAASLTLLRAFQDAGGTRAVFAGTCAEYRWGTGVFDEKAGEIRPATLYGTAKDALRRIVEAHLALGGPSLAWARLFFLYGDGEKPGRLVGDAIRTLLADECFAASAGTQKRDFLHVQDAADALAALLDAPVHGPVNIGSGAAPTVRSVLETIAELIGGHGRIDFGARCGGADEPAEIIASTRRLIEEVGFRPKYELRQGLNETIAWWRRALQATRA